MRYLIIAVCLFLNLQELAAQELYFRKLQLPAVDRNGMELSVVAKKIYEELFRDRRYPVSEPNLYAVYYDEEFCCFLYLLDDGASRWKVEAAIYPSEYIDWKTNKMLNKDIKYEGREFKYKAELNVTQSQAEILAKIFNNCMSFASNSYYIREKLEEDDTLPIGLLVGQRQCASIYGAPPQSVSRIAIETLLLTVKAVLEGRFDRSAETHLENLQKLSDIIGTEKLDSFDALDENEKTKLDLLVKQKFFR